MMNAKPGSGVVTNNVANGLLKDPGAIKVFISTWSNFNFSATGAQRWDKAMAAMPFFVHIVTNPSEMSQFADIVLPATFAPAEKLSIITNMANLHAHASIQQPVIKPLWQAKAEETEVMWLLAEKLKAKGFPNLYDYYASFEDPESKKKPTNVAEFAEIAAKITSAPLWMPKEPLKGDKLAGWDDFRKKGVWNTEKYSFRKNWGKFGTETKKFEFYSETLKKGLKEHAEKHKTTIDDILTVSGYVAQGELAFVPHYEPPKRHGSVAEYPFTFIDYKSRLNREGRSQNAPWYQEFKKVDVGDVSWDDVVKINPQDGKKLGTQERRRGEAHFHQRKHHHEGDALGRRPPGHDREMLRPGPLGLRKGRREGVRQDAPRREQQRSPAGRLRPVERRDGAQRRLRRREDRKSIREGG